MGIIIYNLFLIYNQGTILIFYIDFRKNYIVKKKVITEIEIFKYTNINNMMAILWLN